MDQSDSPDSEPIPIPSAPVCTFCGASILLRDGREKIVSFYVKKPESRTIEVLAHQSCWQGLKDSVRNLKVSVETP
jgi:hypothetical protein